MKTLLTILLGLSLTTRMHAAEKSIVRDLPKATIQQMEKQRAFVADLAVKKSLTHRLAKSDSDFDLLQEILDRKLLRKDQTWELQALGVVFGDALIAKLPGFRWKEVTDAWGTDPALMYKDTSWQLNPVTMIAKRVEKSEDLDVRSFAAQLVEVTLKEAEKSDKR